MTKKEVRKEVEETIKGKGFISYLDLCKQLKNAKLVEKVCEDLFKEGKLDLKLVPKRKR